MDIIDAMGQLAHREAKLSILGLTARASQADIEQAYRLLIKRYHPDAPVGDGARVAEINAAYSALRAMRPTSLRSLPKDQVATSTTHERHYNRSKLVLSGVTVAAGLCLVAVLYPVTPLDTATPSALSQRPHRQVVGVPDSLAERSTMREVANDKPSGGYKHRASGTTAMPDAPATNSTPQNIATRVQPGLISERSFGVQEIRLAAQRPSPVSAGQSAAPRHAAPASPETLRPLRAQAQYRPSPSNAGASNAGAELAQAKLEEAPGRAAKPRSTSAARMETPGAVRPWQQPLLAPWQQPLEERQSQ